MVEISAGERSINATGVYGLLETIAAVLFALVLDRLAGTDMEKADGMMRNGHSVLRDEIIVSLV